MRKNFKIHENKVVPCDISEAVILLFIHPDEAEKKTLVDEYKIDEHTLNSSLDQDELSRLEIEPEHAAIIYKHPKNYSGLDNLVFKVASSGLFLFEDKLIIVMDEEIQLFTIKQFSKVLSVKDVFLKLLYSSIFHFIEHLRVINMIADEIERKINSSFENKYLINLFSIEKSLIYYLNSINSNRALIGKIKLNSSKMGLNVEEVEFLDDLIVENDQCYKQAEIYTNILMGLSDARASIVNNNLNIQMKRLTMITIIFMPLNLLAGIGGMSEYSMMTQGLDWKITYIFFLVAMVVIGYFTYLILRWFERDKKKKK